MVKHIVVRLTPKEALALMNASSNTTDHSDAMRAVFSRERFGVLLAKQERLMDRMDEIREIAEDMLGEIYLSKAEGRDREHRIEYIVQKLIEFGKANNARLTEIEKAGRLAGLQEALTILDTVWQPKTKDTPLELYLKMTRAIVAAINKDGGE
jgi:hypothetical protein